MFAYLLIGVELAVIYAVFWYVFLREPKPHNNKDRARGSKSFTVYGAGRIFSNSHNSSISNDQTSKGSSCSSHPDSVRLSREHDEAGAECSCSVVSPRRRGRQLRLSWLPSETMPPGSNFAERFCNYLGRKLIQFSLKAP